MAGSWATALYTADVLSFVKDTQPKEWRKFYLLKQ